MKYKATGFEAGDNLMRESSILYLTYLQTAVSFMFTYSSFRLDEVQSHWF